MRNAMTDFLYLKHFIVCYRRSRCVDNTMWKPDGGMLQKTETILTTHHIQQIRSNRINSMSPGQLAKHVLLTVTENIRKMRHNS